MIANGNCPPQRKAAKKATEAKDHESQPPTSNPATDTTNKDEDPDSVLSYTPPIAIIQRFKFRRSGSMYHIY